jgi:biopolymer transport protein ExbD
MRKTSRSHHGTLNELNITPLLDLVFVLLVIFIITTPQLMNNLEMTLPSSQPHPVDPNAPRPEIHRILVDSSGRTFLNEEPMTIPALRAGLAKRKAVDPDLSVVVNGADDVNYQSMIQVLDVLQQLDINRVGLATATIASP